MAVRAAPLDLDALSAHGRRPPCRAAPARGRAASAIARSRSHVPAFTVLSIRRQAKPAASELLLFTTLPPSLIGLNACCYRAARLRLSVSTKAPFPSTGTVYSCLARRARHHHRRAVVPCRCRAASPEPRSLSVILRVLASVVSPALRSNSDSVPTEDASQTFCASHGRDLERDRLGHRRLVGALVGDLVDRQHAHVLQHDLGGRRALVDLARQHDVDAVARQHEAADAVDVVDADGHRLHARRAPGRQRGALAGAGDLEREHRLVRLDRGQHDAAAGAGARRRSWRRRRSAPTATATALPAASPR